MTKPNLPAAPDPLLWHSDRTVADWLRTIDADRHGEMAYPRLYDDGTPFPYIPLSWRGGKIRTHNLFQVAGFIYNWRHRPWHWRLMCWLRPHALAWCARPGWF